MTIEIDAEGEMTRVMDLLREYTDKLRTICEEHQRQRERSAQGMLSFAAVGAAAAVAIYYYYGPALGSSVSEWTLPLVAISGFGGALAAYQILLRGRSRYYDAHQVAYTVERLVKVSSQYAEHASHRISQRFEFELRLAEAEAALRFFNSLFRPATPSAER